MKKILIVLLLVMGLCLVTGCNQKSKVDPNLVGKWSYKIEGEEESGSLTVTYTYMEDGTGIYQATVTQEDGTEQGSTKNFTYETKDSKIYITFENDTDVYENGYEVKEDTLVWEDTFGEKIEMTKVIDK